MKKLIYLLCISFSIMVFQSCEEEKDTSCDNVTCLNNGTCVNGTCNCPTGFTGNQCQTTTDPCAGVTCLNGGTCVSGTCNCPTGFTGAQCQTATTGPCAGVTCLNGGTCVSGTCNCPTNYSGDSCQTFTGTTLPTTPFVGNYTGTTTCGSGAIMEVTDSVAIPNRLYFDTGPNDPVADFYGTLTSSSAFNIPQQPLMNTLTSDQVSGSGSISGNQLTMSVTFITSQGNVICSFSLTK